MVVVVARRRQYNLLGGCSVTALGFSESGCLAPPVWAIRVASGRDIGDGRKLATEECLRVYVICICECLVVSSEILQIS